MTGQHQKVNQEISQDISLDAIIKEFPELTAADAEELASRTNTDTAARNVLDIVRNCPPETLATAITIVFDQMTATMPRGSNTSNQKKGPTSGKASGTRTMALPTSEPESSRSPAPPCQKRPQAQSWQDSNAWTPGSASWTP